MIQPKRNFFMSFERERATKDVSRGGERIRRHNVICVVERESFPKGSSEAMAAFPVNESSGK